MSSRGQMANNHAEKWGEPGWKVGGSGIQHPLPHNRYTNKAPPLRNNNHGHNQKANELPGNPLI